MPQKSKVRTSSKNNFKIRYNSGGNPVDATFLILVFLLLGTGLIMMFSAGYAVAYYQLKNPFYFIVRQSGFAGIGIIGMLIISKIDYHFLAMFWKPLVAFSLVLMALVATPLGVSINGAKRWLGVGSFTLQPSEIVKFAVILSFAVIASRIGDIKIKTVKGLMPFISIIGMFCLFLVVFQRHLSATIIICATGFIIIFVAGMSLKHLILTVIAGVVGIVGYISIKDYALDRVKLWFDPFLDPQGKGWQGVQSFLAIGSGGLWGLGLGQSRQKHLYLPEPANDFVFSVVCEELGFIGASLIVIAFIALTVRGYRIAMRSPDKLGCFIVTGVTTQIALQAAINLCVVSGLAPITGASLPFFSYGGTALCILLWEVGFILNVSRQIPVAKNG